MKYTITQFNKDFPNDDVCLDYVFCSKYPSLKEKYYRIRKRKCYRNAAGDEIRPLVGTIFEKSKTPLTLWFYAIFMFSQSRNGVAAVELQRHIGVTEKTALSMARKIRALMESDDDMLSGTVEIDEAYIGGRCEEATKFKNKVCVMGLAERGGKIKAQVIPNRETRTLLDKIEENIEKGSTIMSDDYTVYRKIDKLGYESKRIKHSSKVYAKNGVYTNTVEAFWRQVKSSVRGTHHYVSPQYLQTYLDYFVFQHNHRKSPVHPFHVLLNRI